ncbi:Serine/threonine-protein kinase KIN4 [Pseudozyma hubeiensis]|nr:Serine/threonine-protein kinase KIN4 [Pseudozyma hubeiensis]
MFSRSRSSDAKSLRASPNSPNGLATSAEASAARDPTHPPDRTSTTRASSTAPMHIQTSDLPTITTSNGTPLSSSTCTADPTGPSQPDTPVQASPFALPQNFPHVSAAEPFDMSNTSFSMTSLDSFGAISVAGSTIAAEDGSQNGSRFGMSPPSSRLVAPRSELSSASIRSQRNWDQFEGKPVSPLPSPAVHSNHEQARDMFDVPIASSSRHATSNGIGTSLDRPATVRNSSNESVPSTTESGSMASPQGAARSQGSSRNWSFFNSTSSGPSIARAPSIKTSQAALRAEQHVSSDSSAPQTPLSSTASRNTASFSLPAHDHGVRLPSVDLSNRFRLPSRLPSLSSDATAMGGAGSSNARSSSALYAQPQQTGYPRHSRISSGDSNLSTDAGLYSPLSAVDAHAPGEFIGFSSTSQLSLSGMSDAPSATLEGLPPNVPWAPYSPRRVRTQSQLLLDDDRSAQSSPASAVQGRIEHKGWRDAADSSIDFVSVVPSNVAHRSSPAPSRSELHIVPGPSIPSANVAVSTRDASSASDPARDLGQRKHRQGPSESATGSSISPTPPGREQSSPPVIAEAREEEEDGDRIGPYRIEKTLGVGAFSRVALGRLLRGVGGGKPDKMIATLPELRQRALQNMEASRETDELVALKMLDREPCNNNERLKVSWVREVEVLKHISHPNLVRFISSFSTPVHHTLVLEQIAGGELFDAIMSHFDQFSQREWLVRVIYTELANAVGWMHHVNLVHRDIKLENILMTVDLFAAMASASGRSSPSEPLRPHHLPKGPLVKLTDFGLSRFVDPSNPLLETRCGSEEYAAPELIIGKKYDGRKTDAWALGVVLYALITGSLPFMEDVSVGVNGAREGFGEQRDPKQRKRHLLRIAKGDLRWPAPANDACADQPDPAVCPASVRLVTPMAKAMVARLLRRDSSKRATPWETWDEPWLLGGSFGYAAQPGSTAGGRQVPNERSADGQSLALHPDPRSQQGQHWLETNAAVRQDDVAPVALDD